MSECMEGEKEGQEGQDKNDERKNKVRKLNNFHLILKKVHSSENHYSSRINFIFNDTGLRRIDYFLLFRDISSFVITVSLTSRGKQLNACIGLKITFQVSPCPTSYYFTDGLYIHGRLGPARSDRRNCTTDLNILKYFNDLVYVSVA